MVLLLICGCEEMGEAVPIYLSIVAFICTVGAIVLAVRHIYRHLMNYTEPTYQRFIVRIIFMVPVSAASAFTSRPVLVFNVTYIFFFLFVMNSYAANLA